jgi:hypothetical protein
LLGAEGAGGFAAGLITRRARGEQFGGGVHALGADGGLDRDERAVEGQNVVVDGHGGCGAG